MLSKFTTTSHRSATPFEPRRMAKTIVKLHEENMLVITSIYTTLDMKEEVEIYFDNRKEGLISDK
jgi:prolyl-tRNA editing enzyme YbaK/EbsC (Cys-tRNA(Pro) deacylase)